MGPGAAGVLLGRAVEVAARTLSVPALARHVPELECGEARRELVLHRASALVRVLHPAQLGGVADLSETVTHGGDVALLRGGRTDAVERAAGPAG
jgi:hypothetical protein